MSEISDIAKTGRQTIGSRSESTVERFYLCVVFTWDQLFSRKTTRKKRLNGKLRPKNRNRRRTIKSGQTHIDPT